MIRSKYWVYIFVKTLITKNLGGYVIEVKRRVLLTYLI